MCDVVYTLLVGKLEAEVGVERQCAVIIASAGGKGVEVPSITDARARFDAALEAEPEAVDSEQAELMEALGVR